MRTIAYLRVSTDRQDVDNQRLEILNLANEKSLGQVEFIEDSVSGKVSWKKRKLGELVERLETGDVLLTAELSRLGRSMLEIMEILALCVEREIRVYAAKGNWSLDGTMQSKIVAMVFAMAAEIERDLISQRTKAALATRKAQGKKLGRPQGVGRSKLDAHEAWIRELAGLGVTKKSIAEQLGTSVRNLSNWMKKHGIQRRKGD
ncbi:recombinase family protein [Desulfatibacillum aliphaticivorans]|uniref:recombinase family protein n=1 Tax=Desulfatibacillum aliphaticivorans TaxID=218208 RepID=UPI000404ED61|nr:recombinase family protein [Desulfatibacillum aliphaticivorans]